jgi:hypothetical protein
LSVALEGNIDHVQYTDRIKGIFFKYFFPYSTLLSVYVGLVEFLGPRLSSEELSQIWAMGDKSFHVVDNLHGVLAAAAPKLGAPQFDHLLHLVQEVSSSFCFPLFYLLLYFYFVFRNGNEMQTIESGRSY